MNKAQYKKDVKAIAGHAVAMSVEGLKDSILDDWNKPEWSNLLFDAMNLALEKKIGRRAYLVWFNNLPVKGESK